LTFDEEEAMNRKLVDRSSAVADFDDLLHPSQVFNRPQDVLNDPDLSLNEKRAILASWASDACAVEAAPALRKAPSGRIVQFDEIMDALQLLDRQSQVRRSSSSRVSSHSNNYRAGGPKSEQGTPLH
jgi:hypothetical protein